ncbi:14592_t:CDS:2 [Funneliformis mosseae]|uniref:14592_t:CDS:1 n=1 Tax=Funneliformis mosseae TaxID=27381 RepID=A0A9N9BQD1_FUNMO|nr:14592_t:CDS:2 [Funneliformis mosseae]
MSGKCQNRPESVPKHGKFRISRRDVLIWSGIYTETWVELEN